jgi:hypothetical protein
MDLSTLSAYRGSPIMILHRWLGQGLEVTGIMMVALKTEDLARQAFNRRKCKLVKAESGRPQLGHNWATVGPQLFKGQGVLSLVALAPAGPAGSNTITSKKQYQFELICASGTGASHSFLCSGWRYLQELQVLAPLQSFGPCNN